MSIVCGTDFSESSSRAVAAAAHLATRMKMPLHLVHTVELGDEDEFEEPRTSLARWAQNLLRRKAERLRELGADVEIHVEVGLPDELLLDIARRVKAKLIVVGPAGRRQGKAPLGSHADRIAQRSRVPVLVIRNLEPFEHWARDSRPLRLVLCDDLSSSSHAALVWVNELRAFGPCDVVAVHLYWPPEQFNRLGLGGVRSYLDPDPEVTRALERDFQERLSHLAGAGPVRYRSEPHFGRIGDRLADLAALEHADIVVVGSHHRGTLARLWESSVSRSVLQCAQSSVACIPALEATHEETPRKPRSVLVATDFSSVGDAAIPFAYSSVNYGGTVHVAHVIKQQAAHDSLEPHDVFGSSIASEAHRVLHDRLLKSVSSDALGQGKFTVIHVLESSDPAQAICQAAERLGVDILCLGTQSTLGVAATVLGSVAKTVVKRSTRPVLLIHLPAA